MNFRSQFGNLRSLLHAGPSPHTWKLLCEFVDQWTQAEDFQRIGVPYIQGLLSRWPDEIRSAPMHWLEHRLAPYAQPPQWAIVRTIDCHGHIFGQMTWRKIGREVFDQHVQTLRARSLPLTPRELEVLLESSNCTHIKHLDFTKTPLPIANIQIVATCPYLNNIKRLDASECKLGKLGVQMICISPYMENLETLKLQNDRIGANVLPSLLDSAFGPKLKNLDLSDNHIGPRGAEFLGTNTTLRSLETLRLKNCALGASGIARLLSKPAQLPALKHLILEHNEIGSAGFRAVFRSDLMPQLESLNVGYNKIGGDALIEFFNSAKITNLKNLAIHWNPASPVVPQLKAQASSAFSSIKIRV